MKKTMKKRAFISAIAMLIVSAIVLTSSTFAWFSMAKRVEVETMQLNITSPEGIQISANTNAFTTKLTMDDFKGTSTTRFVADSTNTNHFPEVLSPSSSTFRMTNALPVFYSGSINDKGRANISAVTDAAGGYVVFDLYVKLGVAQTVYWGESSITCENADVPTAMRIGMVNCGASEDKTAAKTIFADPTACVYEIDSMNHTEDSGVADGTYVSTTVINGTITDRVPSGDNNNIVTGSGISALTTVTDTNKSAVCFSGEAGINRIRVYIYMEGNDVDCANDVAGSTINVNLVFTIA